MGRENLCARNTQDKIAGKSPRDKVPVKSDGTKSLENLNETKFL
jgi:hypothetical protein